MRHRTERQVDHVLLVVLALTGAYGSIYAAGLLLQSVFRPTRIVEHLTATVPGWAFLGSVGAWVAILGGWKLRSIHRDVTRDPDAAARDEVLTTLRDALDERDRP